MKQTRRLLDAERITFTTNDKGLLESETGEALLVCLRAERWTQHASGPGGGPTHLAYDIVLERSVHGVPAIAVPLIGAAVVLLALVLVGAPWWSARVVPALLAWLNADSTSEGARRRKL